MTLGSSLSHWAQRGSARMATSLRGIAICKSKCLMLSVPSIVPKDGDAKSRAAVLGEGGIEASDQGLAIEGLAQKADRSRPQSPGAIAFDGEGRDEDERK